MKDDHSPKSRIKTSSSFINPKDSEMISDESCQNNTERKDSLEYAIYRQLKTWKDNKATNKDLDHLDGNYLECKVEFDEKKNTKTHGRELDNTKGLMSNLNPLMFSFTERDTSNLEINDSLVDSILVAQDHKKTTNVDPNRDINSKIKNSIENLLKLNEILRMNLENEAPTVVSSSETQLELDQITWDELFRDSQEHFSKVDFLEKLTDQILSSIKSLIMGEALLGADNARQMLLFELKSLQRIFNENNQEKVSKSIECLLMQTNSDDEINMLIFKIDQIRSALRHFNLSNRFEDFNFGYSNLSHIESDDVERMLHSNQASNFFAKHKLFKINRWHKQSSSSFDKSINNSALESNSSNRHIFHHHDGQSHHRNILSHYKNHQQRNSCIKNEKNGDVAKKDDDLNTTNEKDIQLLASVSNNSDGWNIEHSKGISLSYKIDSSPNGQISINVVIKSEIKCKLLNLLTILNEVELSNMWVPYMSYSKCFYNFSRVSKLVQQIYDLPWPIGQRENIMFCFGVDTLREHNCIMISCGDPQTTNNKFFGVKIPDPPPKVPREKCSYLLFILTPSDVDKDTTTLEMFSSFCVTKYVPVKLTSFLIKRMTKKMYVDIASLASNLNGSPYGTAYNSNLQLYSWLDMKLTQYYELRQRKGD
ncbi:hypothetical protein OJ253_3465 [Cryptosporidium canis]|uniref:START domain-containing protein n=1 Tax=Cryptosporidium canis TaxID=195482 RepID=A0A9D5DJP9_9CRYT|nr:hypothetical protein OJ253_3465 [Cryptosporidium canis]